MEGGGSRSRGRRRPPRLPVQGNGPISLGMLWRTSPARIRCSPAGFIIPAQPTLVTRAGGRVVCASRRHHLVGCMMATTKFAEDLATRLSEIADAGATSSSVIALMVSLRRVIEDTHTQHTYRLAWLFCTWSVHTTMDRNKAIIDVLDGINDIIVAISQYSVSGVVTEAISQKIRIDDLRSEIIDICRNGGIDSSPIENGPIWDSIRHCLLDILCDIPLSIPLSGADFKSLVAKHSSATRIVSSFAITNNSGSPLLQDKPYYWRVSLTDTSDLNAAPVTVVGAVIL